ncbi:hypothetical protein BCR44DRAFT_1540004 [Catenaria anguillulae PL171]|uniref:Uncharacterized protein n=1 Tax=Catenaria anguillulae PL171 TaxID=765915 RepID=A0A1Y2HZ97_9FUNG|nr:hypothetical protein BCR44DRAFT_1540004 [Catenaria anguillulae PL171]
MAEAARRKAKEKLEKTRAKSAPAAEHFPSPSPAHEETPDESNKQEERGHMTSATAHVENEPQEPSDAGPRLQSPPVPDASFANDLGHNLSTTFDDQSPSRCSPVPARQSLSSSMSFYSAPPTPVPETNTFDQDYGLKTQGVTSVAPATGPRPPETQSDPHQSPTAAHHHGQSKQDATTKRIDRILNYLNVTDLATAHASTPTASSSPHPHTTAGIATVSPAFDAVKSRLIALELEVEDKARSIAALKQQLHQSRLATQNQAQDHARLLKSQLALQRKEYEAAIKRHLAFIDKTLAEKETLATQCAELGAHVKKMEAELKAKLAGLAEKHDREMKSAKGVWEASEKIKRDKWMSMQAAKIKEQTVKGLEPEIQRMLASHKTAMAMAEEKWREQWVGERTSLMRAHEIQIANLRDQWMGERTRAVDEEREAARARYAKQLERDEMEHAQAKRKWMAEMAEVKDALQSGFRDEMRSMEAAHRKAMDELRAQIEEERDGKMHAMEDLRRKHAHELSKVQEQARVEREAWQQAYIAKVEADIRSREREFKDQLLRERDREIEHVISRLEQESGSSSSEMAAKHREEVEQLRARHAEEMKAAHEQWTVAMDKLVTMGRQVEAQEAGKRDLERELWSLKSAVEAKDKTVGEMKRKLDRYQAGESEIRKAVGMRLRNSWVQRRTEASVRDELQHRDQLISSLRHEMDRVKGQLAQQQREANDRVASVQQEKMDTLNMIEDRVKKTIATKDQALAEMREQMEEMRMRNGQLELLLERQRKELLMST